MPVCSTILADSMRQQEGIVLDLDTENKKFVRELHMVSAVVVAACIALNTVDALAAALEVTVVEDGMLMTQAYSNVNPCYHIYHDNGIHTHTLD